MQQFPSYHCASREQSAADAGKATRICHELYFLHYIALVIFDIDTQDTF
jgi:hypothetical protein